MTADDLAPAPRRSRYDWTRDDLASRLDGLPRYRVDQVWEGLYVHGTEPAEWSNLPAALRAELAVALPRRSGWPWSRRATTARR